MFPENGSYVVIESIVLILTAGLVADRLLSRLQVPGLLGMILVGIALGPQGLGLLDPAILGSSADIRLVALVIILLRAGLGLSREALRAVGGVAIKMSAFPCLIEGGVAMIGAHLMLGLPLVEAGMLGFVLAAVSPAVVVPAMIELRRQGSGGRAASPSSSSPPGTYTCSPWPRPSSSASPRQAARPSSFPPSPFATAWPRAWRA